MYNAPLIYTLFALSGFAGLIYEGTWARYLKLFLGHSSYGQIATLVIYMGGLGLGAFLAARFLPRINRPLRAYAITEILIALCAIAFHPIYVGITDWFYSTHISAEMGRTTAEVLKLFLATACTLPTAILLGLTFPWVAAGLMRMDGDQGRHSLPRLYFTNCLGASVGILATSYIFIPQLGSERTLWVGASLDLLTGVLFFIIDARCKQKSESALALAGTNPIATPKEETPPPLETLEQPEKPGPSTNLWLWLAALTGLTSFGYQVVWIRLLSLMMGSSTHSFDIMLSAFILGLALGGLVASRLLRKDLVETLGWVQVGMGLAALGTLYFHGTFFSAMNMSNLVFMESAPGYHAWSFFKFILAVLWMVPASFFAGTTLPLITYSLIRKTRNDSCTGKVYGFNTMGAITGALLAGVFLIPVLQLKWALVLCAVGDVAIGWYLLTRYRPRWRNSFAFQMGLLACLLPIFFVSLDSWVVTAGMFRDHKPQNIDQNFVVRSGRSATISFHESRLNLYIKTNGKADASMARDRSKPVAGDELTQAATAFMPMALRDSSYDAAMVGFGSGMSAHYMLADPLLRSLDVVEIEREMVSLARGFMPHNYRGYEDPRVGMYYDDARTFFHTIGRTYDVIVSIPSNPWVSGVASLFTVEYYNHMRRYLRPGGHLVQWLQLYEFNDTLMKHILVALDQSFPHVSVYRVPEEPDIVIIASDQPVRQKYLDRLRNTPEIKTELEKHMQRPWWFFGEHNFLTTTRMIAPLLEKHPANSEFFPWVDIRAEQARFVKESVNLFEALDSCKACWQDYLDSADFAPRLLQRHWILQTHSPDRYLQSSIEYHLRAEQVRDWRRLFNDFNIWISAFPFTAEREEHPLYIAFRDRVKAGEVPTEIGLEFAFAEAMARRDYSSAMAFVALLEKAYHLQTLDPFVVRHMILAALHTGNIKKAKDLFRDGVAANQAMPLAEKQLIIDLIADKNGRK